MLLIITLAPVPYSSDLERDFEYVIRFLDFCLNWACYILKKNSKESSGRCYWLNFSQVAFEVDLWF